ncbi:MAG: glycosyltransferase family 9 protein [Chlorobiaceae bacterium]|jgi:hypothetical protein|nr:glycosyltransferase family 9 protein [Chlorobiaceae bacterium]
MNHFPGNGNFFSMMINKLLQFFNLFVLYRFGSAIGDQLCMTAIVENLYTEHRLKTVVFSSYPEFFENNPHVYKNFSFKRMPKLFRNVLLSLLRIAEGENIANFCFPKQKNGGLECYMRETKAKISLIEAHSCFFKRKLILLQATPKIYFSDDELAVFSRKFSDLPDRFGIVQPVGKTTYTPNKEWGFANFQKVIDSAPHFPWLQTGMINELLLDHVIDFRGKTKSLRELAYIVSRADFILCLEGLLNHLAASVGTRSFCLFSGFHPVEIANYATTIPVVLDPQPDCSPCWLLEKCPQKSKYCTEGIFPEQVVKVITTAPSLNNQPAIKL